MLLDLIAVGFALSLIVVFVLANELHDRTNDLALERCERERLEGRLAERSRERRLVPAPWQAQRSLPPVRELPAHAQPAKDVLALETAGLAFTDPPRVIDRPYHSAHTVEHALPEITWVNPMRPDHARFLPLWPGAKKESVRVR
jgi:hypothetical protein